MYMDRGRPHHPTEENHPQTGLNVTDKQVDTKFQVSMARQWPDNWRSIYPLSDLGAPSGTEQADGTTTGALPTEVMLNIISYLTPVPDRRNDLFSDHDPTGGWHVRNVVHAHRGPFRIAMGDDFTSTTTFLIDRENRPTHPEPALFVHSTGSSEGFVQYLQTLSPEKASQIRHIALVDYDRYPARPARRGALRDFERLILRPFMHKLALESVGLFHCMRCYRMEDRWFGTFGVNHWPSQLDVLDPVFINNNQGVHWMGFETRIRTMASSPGTTTLNDFAIERTSTRKGPYPEILREWQNRRIDLLANALNLDSAQLRTDLDQLGGDTGALYRRRGFQDPAPNDGIGEACDPMRPTTQQMLSCVRHARLIFRRKQKITKHQIDKVQVYWKKYLAKHGSDHTRPRYNLRVRGRPHSYAEPSTRTRQQSSMIV